MRRHPGVLIVTILMMALAATDLTACGDKFLRVGRSSRFRAYASVHPSAILVYAPRWTKHGIADMEEILKRAGHRPVTVTTHEAMVKAVADTGYELVITMYPDAPTVKRDLASVAAKPALLPIVFKATKAQAADAEATYACLLRPEKMTPFQALQEIDRVLDLRIKEHDTAAR